MPPEQILLQQVADAVQGAERARDNVARYYKAIDTWNLGPDSEASRKDFLRADLKYDQQLSAALPITALYAAHYSKHMHRCSRIANILDECRTAHHAIEDVVATFHGDLRISRHLNELNHLTTVGKTLDLAANALTAMIASSSASDANLLSQEGRVRSEKEQAAAHHLQSLKDREVSIRVPPLEYFRTRSRFESRRQASRSTTFLTRRELKIVVVEKLSRPFQRFESNYKPIYQEVKDEAHHEFRFDSINAVWHSLIASDGIEKRGASTYRKIVVAAGNVRLVNQTTQQPLSYYGTLDAVGLCKGLCEIDIVLGVIFADDPTSIIWWAGKASAQQQREVIIYSGVDYQGVKLLNLGERAVRAPRARFAFTNIGNTAWVRGNIESWRVRPCQFKMLSSLRDIAKQSSSAWKPFPFLKLPAELRNRVYEEYLTEDSYLLDWATIRLFWGGITVPELCQTSRQLLHEVFPMYLANRTIRICVR